MSDNLSDYDIIIEKTVRGKEILLLHGYQYIINSSKHNRFYWQCAQKASKQCRSSVITDKNGHRHTIFKKPSEHSHSPDAAKTDEITLRNRLKRDAESSFSAPAQIIQNNLAQTPSSSACSVPNKNALRQVIRRARKKLMPVEPKTLEEINIPDKMKEVEGERFLARDITYGENKRMLIFCTKANLEILRDSRTWLMDGTFQSCPGLFKQIYTIHAYIGNDDTNKRTVPVVYCLLVNKTEETYMTFFKELKSYALVECDCILNPQHIVTDFETAVINVIKIEFPDAVHNGCLFHLGQNIWRKIQSSQLATRYGRDNDFSLKLRHIIALAYLPAEEIPDAFAKLKEKVLPKEADEVTSYFEKYYVLGRMQSRDGGVIVTKIPPIFPPSLWSVHRSSSLHMPRTQNKVEAWHRRWNGLLNQTRFGLYTTIQYMQKEQMTTNHYIEKARSCVDKTPPRKKGMRRMNAIEKILHNKSKTEVIDFLRAIANNVDL